MGCIHGVGDLPIGRIDLDRFDLAGAGNLKLTVLIGGVSRANEDPIATRGIDHVDVVRIAIG